MATLRMVRGTFLGTPTPSSSEYHSTENGEAGSYARICSLKHGPSKKRLENIILNLMQGVILRSPKQDQFRRDFVFGSCLTSGPVERSIPLQVATVFRCGTGVVKRRLVYSSKHARSPAKVTQDAFEFECGLPTNWRQGHKCVRGASLPKVLANRERHGGTTAGTNPFQRPCQNGPHGANKERARESLYLQAVFRENTPSPSSIGKVHV